MRRGFTLIELAFVVAMLGALVAIGWGSVYQHIPRYRLVRTAKMFRGQLMKMRHLAVQTNRETRVELQANGGDCGDGVSWGGKWEMAVGDNTIGSSFWDVLPEDTHADGSDDLNGTGLVDIGRGGNLSAKDVCLGDWGNINGPSVNGASNQDSIVFNPRGWISNPTSDFNSRGYIEFHFYNQEATRDNRTDKLTVQLSRAGMTRLVSYRDQHPENAVGTSESSTIQ